MLTLEILLKEMRKFSEENFYYDEFSYADCKLKISNMPIESFDNKPLSSLINVFPIALDYAAYVIFDLDDEGKYHITFRNLGERRTVDDIQPLSIELYKDLRKKIEEKVKLFQDLNCKLYDKKLEDSSMLVDIIRN